jgi:hypothetical protein
MSAERQRRVDEPPEELDPQRTRTATDVRRCWGCRRLWPQTAMRWGLVNEGPLWYPRPVRVLRCPDCLA